MPLSLNSVATIYSWAKTGKKLSGVRYHFLNIFSASYVHILFCSFLTERLSKWWFWLHKSWGIAILCTNTATSKTIGMGLIFVCKDQDIHQKAKSKRLNVSQVTNYTACTASRMTWGHRYHWRQAVTEWKNTTLPEDVARGIGCHRYSIYYKIHTNTHREGKNTKTHPQNKTWKQKETLQIQRICDVFNYSYSAPGLTKKTLMHADEITGLTEVSGTLTTAFKRLMTSLLYIQLLLPSVT